MKIQAGMIHKPAECCCTYSKRLQEIVTTVHTKAATQHKLKDQLSCQAPPTKKRGIHKQIITWAKQLLVQSKPETGVPALLQL
jgi:hypothetical protein